MDHAEAVRILIVTAGGGRVCFPCGVCVHYQLRVSRMIDRVQPLGNQSFRRLPYVGLPELRLAFSLNSPSQCHGIMDSRSPFGRRAFRLGVRMLLCALDRADHL
jgi:hypothetical protein